MALWTSAAILLLCLALIVGLLLTLLGMPGNWLIVLAAAAYTIWGPAEGLPQMGLYTVLTLFALAVLGEILEFVLGAVTARRAGGSRRAAVGALGGGLAGAVAGMFVGIPIPFVGPFLAAILFASLGAMAGAYMAQQASPEWEEQQKAWQIGKAAFWGRLSGTLAKLLIGMLMVIVATAALVVG